MLSLGAGLGGGSAVALVFALKQAQIVIKVYWIQAMYEMRGELVTRQ